MMRYARLGLLLLLAISSVPMFAVEPIDPDILAVREAAWRAWFGGDEATLRSILPEDFLSIGWGGTEISNRDQAIASSLEFKKSGGRLVSLSFPETRAQRAGDTVVFYGTFEVTFAHGTAETKIRGALTEVFVKRDGRWLHPGWHVDSR